MKKILFSALALSVLSFISCSKSDDNNSNEENSTSVYLPVKITSENYVSTFTYDGKNQLIETKEADLETDYSSVATFVYNDAELTSAKKVTTEIEKKADGTEKTYVSIVDYIFVYQDNKVTVTKKTNYNGSDTTNTLVSEYNINQDGKLLSGNNLTFTYDDKGNLTKEVNQWSESTYQFDDKNGIFKSVKTPQWTFYVVIGDFYEFKVNNVTKTLTKETGETSVETSTMTYQYNSANYPAKINIVGSDNYSNSVTIEYIKKIV